jgi:hypothetical protein
MPSLLDDRQEKFCQEIARDASIEAAMCNAGYSPTNAYRNGTRMLQKPLFADRVAELCREMGKEYPNTPKRTLRPGGAKRRKPLPDPEDVDLSLITYEWMQKKVVGAFLTAERQGNVSAMVKLLDQIGRLTGIDKRPNGRPPQQKDPNKGDVSNDKPKPDNPIDFATLVAGYGGDRDGAGDTSADEDAADSEVEDDAE